jgi:hypothetical protein
LLVELSPTLPQRLQDQAAKNGEEIIREELQYSIELFKINDSKMCLLHEPV